ncbi:hypothetical protein PT974_12193 [Cladobotryum mycophilum]|uniref:Uncharacterized protein n=1 Tax=Cladobotryum mycophilum TaxID=491253 RepID=A0ABR0S7B0_9HYPO
MAPRRSRRTHSKKEKEAARKRGPSLLSKGCGLGRKARVISGAFYFDPTHHVYKVDCHIPEGETLPDLTRLFNKEIGMGKVDNLPTPSDSDTESLDDFTNEMSEVTLVDTSTSSEIIVGVASFKEVTGGGRKEGFPRITTEEQPAALISPGSGRKEYINDPADEPNADQNDAQVEESGCGDPWVTDMDTALSGCEEQNNSMPITSIWQNDDSDGDTVDLSSYDTIISEYTPARFEAAGLDADAEWDRVDREFLAMNSVFLDNESTSQDATSTRSVDGTDSNEVITQPQVPAGPQHTKTWQSAKALSLRWRFFCGMPPSNTRPST